MFQGLVRKGKVSIVHAFRSGLPGFLGIDDESASIMRGSDGFEPEILGRLGRRQSLRVQDFGIRRLFKDL